MNDTLGADSAREVSTPSRWRFGSRSIFWLMLLVGVALAIERLYGPLYFFVVMLLAAPVIIRRRTTTFDLALCRGAAAPFGDELRDAAVLG